MCFVALESVALSRVASASAGWPSARRGSCVVQSDCFTPAFSSRMDTTPSPHSEAPMLRADAWPVETEFLWAADLSELERWLKKLQSAG